MSSASFSRAMDRPETVLHASRPPGYIFKSLPRLVATSDVVVVGTVESAEKGARIVPDDDLYHRAVTVSVTDQLYGPSVASTITVREDGYNGDTPFELEEQPWLYPGDRAVYFLAQPGDAPPHHYNIIAAPGRLTIEEDGSVSTKAIDPIARELDGRSWDDVKQAIRAAVEKARDEDVPPLPPGP